MKHIRNILLVLGATTFSSCGDFLDILPLNEVVLENYWTEKADVTSVLSSCYESMENTENITRIGLWGEIRSDNMVSGTSVGWQINDLLKENLQPNNPLCTWASMYQTINRCNTVCHYAPMVRDKDPNYKDADMRANVAEATALRALCYFYLIRTFRDVPYSTEPSIDDTQEYKIPATPFAEVLDKLIADLENVKDDAVKRFYTDENALAYYNSAYITRWAIYAMLADMYLWKGDYDNSIKYCDLILDYKKQQYEDLKEENGGTLNDMFLFNGYPLMQEKPTGSNYSGYAYSDIFGAGHSFESIFELHYRSGQSQKNSMVATYYGTASTDIGQLSAPDFLYKDVVTGGNSLFKKTDCRVYESIEPMSARYAIAKYVREDVLFNTTNVNSEKDLKLSATRRGTDYSNWIVYRMTDIMLIKAEAELLKGDSNFPTAFSLINAVNKRANNVVSTASSDTLKYSTYSGSRQSMEELLMDERQRELLFEGKRWFDLVRLARRDGNTKRLVSYVADKYVDNVNAIRIKLADPDIIYYPYSKSELKVNPYLKQNRAYDNEDTEITK